MMDDMARTLAFFDRMTTDQLVRIWKANDRTAWTDDAFLVAAKLLRQRGIELAVQDPAIERGVPWFPLPALLGPRPYDHRARRLIAYEATMLAGVALFIALGVLGIF